MLMLLVRDCNSSHFGISGLVQYMNRDSMRKRYNIEGSSLKDCLISCCCSCCALIQEEKEVKMRNEQAAVPEAAVGYQQQEEGMQYRATGKVAVASA